MVARKGQPNLSNDPGRMPDWKERVKKRAPTEQRKRFMFRSSWAFVSLVSKAARLRGMTSSAYARRAISAFIASDLQMPFEDVCQHSPSVKSSAGIKTWTPDDGAGYGKWEVQP